MSREKASDHREKDSGGHTSREALVLALEVTAGAALVAGARHYLKHRRSADPDDMVQDTYEKVLRRGGYRGNSSLGTWGYRIMLNTVKDHNEKEGRTNGKLVDDQDSVIEQRISADPLKDPEQALLQNELRQEVAQALLQLSLIQREIIIRSMGGASYPEIAEELGMPLGTVKSYAHRAQEKLQVLLSHRRPEHLPEPPKKP